MSIKVGKTYKVNRASLITVKSIEDGIKVCKQCGEYHKIIVTTKGARLLDTGSFVEHLDWDTPI